MGETGFLPFAKGHTVAKRQLGYLSELVWVRATETESLYQVSMHHRSSSAHMGDKCNLSLDIQQWSQSWEKTGQRGRGESCMGTNIKVFRAVSLVLVEAERHTDEVWSCVTGTHTESTNKQWREVMGGTCQFQSREDDSYIIQYSVSSFQQFNSGWNWKLGQKHSLRTCKDLQTQWSTHNNGTEVSAPTPLFFLLRPHNWAPKTTKLYELDFRQ